LVIAASGLALLVLTAVPLLKRFMPRHTETDDTGDTNADAPRMPNRRGTVPERE